MSLLYNFLVMENQDTFPQVLGYTKRENSTMMASFKCCLSTIKDYPESEPMGHYPDC